MVTPMWTVSVAFLIISELRAIRNSIVYCITFIAQLSDFVIVLDIVTQHSAGLCLNASTLAHERR